MALLSTASAQARFAAVAACVAFAAPVRAGVLDAGATDRLALDVPDDTVITGLAVVGATLPLIFSGSFAPKSCRWCDGSLGSPVNPIDSWFHDRLAATVFSRNTANTISSVAAYALAPAVALTGAFVATGPHATSGAGVRAAVIVAESVAVAEALTESIKFTVGRQRPYVHYQHFATESTSSDLPVLSSDANLGFPSGHTSLAAAVGTSAAMVATLEESSAAPWLWGAAGVLTVATGTLRMISESHYFTDVLGGAALGAGCGVLFPLLHRRGSALGGGAVPSVRANAQGASFSIGGSF
jgi:membrane-associated phospholipid phosphatase